jgi:hypothetical protein
MNINHPNPQYIHKQRTLALTFIAVDAVDAVYFLREGAARFSTTLVIDVNDFGVNLKKET